MQNTVRVGKTPCDYLQVATIMLCTECLIFILLTPKMATSWLNQFIHACCDWWKSPQRREHGRLLFSLPYRVTPRRNRDA